MPHKLYEQLIVKRSVSVKQLKHKNEFILYAFFVNSSTSTRKILSSVKNLCTPFQCRQECLNYVRELKSSPCFNGEVGDMARYFLLDRNEESRLEYVHWFAALDSCDQELWAEENNKKDCESVTGGAMSLSFMTVLNVLSMALGLIYTSLY